MKINVEQAIASRKLLAERLHEFFKDQRGKMISKALLDQMYGELYVLIESIKQADVGGIPLEAPKFMLRFDAFNKSMLEVLPTNESAVWMTMLWETLDGEPPHERQA